MQPRQPEYAGHAPDYAIGVFANGHQAKLAVDDLMNSGFSREDMRLIRRNAEQLAEVLEEARTNPDHAAEESRGGVGGTLAGSEGGITGALADWGLPDDVAERCARQVQQGDVVVAVHCRWECDRARAILTNYGARDLSR